MCLVKLFVSESIMRDLFIPRQEFNRLAQSSIKCINDYHKSSRVRHGTPLHVLPFDLETMYLWSCLSQK